MRGHGLAGRRLASAAAGLTLFGLMAGVHADENSPRAGDGALSLRGDVWSGTRGLDDLGPVAALSAWGHYKLDAGAAGSVYADGWMRAAEVRDQDESIRDGRVRELYWRYDHGPVEVRAGRQIVVWGRADGFNPTDNLSPRDFTLLAPEDGDQRYGNLAVQCALSSERGKLMGLWFPRTESHIVPLQSIPAVYYSKEPSTEPAWAVKWEASASGLDGSLSYYHGADPMPDINFKSLTAGGLLIAVRNHRVDVLGADLSMTRGGVVWRAEAAYTWTESTGSQDFEHKKPQLWVVAGGEWSADGTATIGLQATYLGVSDYGSPDQVADPSLREIAWQQAVLSNQTSSSQTGITWRLANRWQNDSLSAELTGVAVWPTRSGVVRAKANYALDDHWQVQIGADHYYGPEQSFFGQLKKNQLVYLQTRYGF